MCRCQNSVKGPLKISTLYCMQTLLQNSKVKRYINIRFNYIDCFKANKKDPIERGLRYRRVIFEKKVRWDPKDKLETVRGTPPLL